MFHATGSTRLRMTHFFHDFVNIGHFQVLGRFGVMAVLLSSCAWVEAPMLAELDRHQTERVLLTRQIRNAHDGIVQQKQTYRQRQVAKTEAEELAAKSRDNLYRAESERASLERDKSESDSRLEKTKFEYGIQLQSGNL